MTRRQEEAPAARGYEGQTNTTDCTLPPADRYPSHPANLLPSLAEHLLVVTFGASWAAASAGAVKAAQGLALTIAIVRGVASRKPVPAVSVAKLAGGEGEMLAAYARLASDLAVTVTDNVGEARECRRLDFTRADNALVPQDTAPLPHTVAFNELALHLHLNEFAEHARHHEYTEAYIVELADTITPPFPFKPWREVATELGVIA
ncbi:hypothetical protein [Bifidobacterium pseudolongum]|uniref:hypothetical protein n=1 Tax=Bifidobacterium pseudolongum TaxID=1694 RepID=UPI00102028E3|nr:hypothetical protein [Bifidobacterium pseudolongum]RYQ70293.1 hypothetical protein PG2103B_0410 [Bifidobacterium pseudolongum subsp. globosum]